MQLTKWPAIQNHLEKILVFILDPGWFDRKFTAEECIKTLSSNCRSQIWSYCPHKKSQLGEIPTQAAPLFSQLYLVFQVINVVQEESKQNSVFGSPCASLSFLSKNQVESLTTLYHIQTSSTLPTTCCKSKTMLSGNDSSGPAAFPFLHVTSPAENCGTSSNGGGAQASMTKVVGVVGEGVGKSQPSQGETRGGTSQSG